MIVVEENGFGLSKDNLCQIFSYLLLKDLESTSQVCKHWTTFLEDESFWKSMCYSTYPSLHMVSNINCKISNHLTI